MNDLGWTQPLVVLYESDRQAHLLHTAELCSCHQADAQQTLQELNFCLEHARNPGGLGLFAECKSWALIVQAWGHSWNIMVGYRRWSVKRMIWRAASVARSARCRSLNIVMSRRWRVGLYLSANMPNGAWKRVPNACDAWLAMVLMWIWTHM